MTQEPLTFCFGCGERWPCDAAIVLEWLDLTSAILQAADDTIEDE